MFDFNSDTEDTIKLGKISFIGPVNFDVDVEI